MKIKPVNNLTKMDLQRLPWFYRVVDDDYDPSEYPNIIKYFSVGLREDKKKPVVETSRKTRGLRLRGLPKRKQVMCPVHPNKQKSFCKACGGSQICTHNMQKKSCTLCKLAA